MKHETTHPQRHNPTQTTNKPTSYPLSNPKKKQPKKGVLGGFVVVCVVSMCSALYRLFCYMSFCNVLFFCFVICNFLCCGFLGRLGVFCNRYDTLTPPTTQTPTNLKRFFLFGFWVGVLKGFMCRNLAFYTLYVVTYVICVDV